MAVVCNDNYRWFWLSLVVIRGGCTLWQWIAMHICTSAGLYLYDYVSYRRNKCVFSLRTYICMIHMFMCKVPIVNQRFNFKIIHQLRKSSGNYWNEQTLTSAHLKERTDVTRTGWEEWCTSFLCTTRYQWPQINTYVDVIITWPQSHRLVISSHAAHRNYENQA